MIIYHDFPLELPSTTPSYKIQVQSHVIGNVENEADNMRRDIFYLLISLAFFYCCVTFTAGNQISVENSNSLNLMKQNLYERTKREIEDLDSTEFPTSSAQDAEEEPSFWERMVKAALKLFNKIIQWLNT